MKYAELAGLYEKLENTSSKLAKRDAIADFLRKVPTDLIPGVTTLMTGKVFPAWSEEELGVANQLMIRAIARSVGTKPSDVSSKFRETGDLGLTAEQFAQEKKQRTLLKKELTIKHTFETMQSIARQSGPGSQDRKMNLIVALLSHAKPKEARYIVRTILQTLRVGVAEGIVRDAIAVAFKVDPKLVEAAWFLRPDYGEVARIAKESGESGLRAAKAKVGMPIIPLLAEKAPSLEAAMKAYENFVIEYKYDGMRIQIHKKDNRVALFTRRLENVTNAFPDIVKLCKKAIKENRVIMEGEAIGLNPKTGRPMPFQMLSTRIKRKHDIEKAVRQIPVQVNLFDILYLNGKTLFDMALRDRFEILKKSFVPEPGIKLVDRLLTEDPKKAEEFYRKALSDGQEGVMVKNLDALYVSGRRVAGGWLKVKPVMETLDLAIIGAAWGTGKRTGQLGSYILGCRDPTTGDFLECGMLGTGIKEKKTKPGDITLEDMTRMLRPNIISEKGGRVRIKPKIIIEVAYEEIQKSPTYSSGWALRFPRLIRLRPEKGIGDADSVQRIKHLYNIQKGKTSS